MGMPTAAPPSPPGPPGLPGRDPGESQDPWAGYDRARRRRRRLRRARIMLSLLAVCTAAVLVVIVVMIRDIGKQPTTASPAALAVSSSASATPSAKASPRANTSPAPAVIGIRHQVADTSSGLSYVLLASPWRRGCPLQLNTPMFSWSAGENAVAGHATIDGTATEWYGNACSGLLGQQFAYSGTADLEPTAMGLVGALDPAYCFSLQHRRTCGGSAALTINGHHE